MSDRRFERIATERVFEGKIFSVDRDVFRFADDGEEAPREIVRHEGAVGVVAVDEEHVWLVRQPREAAGDPDMLEVPAGRLDREGESPLEAARRELGEEIGKRAEDWEHLRTFFTSVGILDEQLHLYLASGLSDVAAEAADENERIEIVAWPLDRLAEAIQATRDAKTIIALLLLERRLAGRA